MKLGLMAAFGNSPRRGVGFLKDAARHIEALGFNSLWMPEHVVFFPADSYQSKYPYSADGAPPWQGDEVGLFDPLFAIGVAAQATTTLRFGASVLILPQRPAMLTAKEVLTLDHIAEGRFELGVGSGWSHEEYEALGASFERRGKRLDEYILAIKAAWTQDRASFHGEFIDFQDVIMRPRPYTPGGPPILVGGNSPPAMRRAAAIGDGWYGWWSQGEVAPLIEALRAELRKAGRENDAGFRLKLGTPHDGDADSLQRKIEAVRREGVEELVLSLPFSAKAFEADLEHWAQACGLR